MFVFKIYIIHLGYKENMLPFSYNINAMLQCNYSKWNAWKKIDQLQHTL